MSNANATGHVEGEKIAAGVVVNDENAVVEGGFKTDFPFQIVDAFYTFHQDYMKGERLVLKVSIIDEEDNEERTELWSIGDHWEAVTIDGLQNDGIKPLKNQKALNSASTLGSIILDLRQGKFGEDAQKHLLPKSLRRGSSWIGTRWQMGLKDVPDMGKKNEDGTVKMVQKRRPVDFLGVVGEGTNKPASNSSTPNATGNTSSNTAGNTADPQAAMLAQMAALQKQVAEAAAKKAAEDEAARIEAEKAAGGSAANGPELVLMHLVDQAKLGDLAKAGKDSNNAQEFMVKAAMIDQSCMTNPVLQQSLITGKLWEEMKFLAAGL